MRASTDHLALLLVLLLLAGCGSGAGPDWREASPGRFSARLLPGSDPARLSFSTARDGDSTLMRVTAEGLENARSLFVEISYDNSRLRDAGLLQPAGDERLRLLARKAPGVLHYGEVVAGRDAAGLSGTLLLAEIRFTDSGLRAEETRDSPRVASKAVPAVDDLARNAKWNILSWSYISPGDYDQNGVVSISDLTPLGQNFGATGPFDPASAQWMVDGDGNGEINLADISVIGQHFGNSVSGYELYASPEGAGHPDTSGARLVASLDLQDSVAGGGERLSFQLTDLDVTYEDRYWVVPSGGGTASGLTPAWQPQWHETLIMSNSYDTGYTIGRPRVEVIGNRTCVAWIGGGTNINWFTRSTDELGESWQAPLAIPTGFEAANPRYILERDGRPAVIFNAEGSFYYKSASLPDGSEWNENVAFPTMPGTILGHVDSGSRLHVLGNLAGVVRHHFGDTADPTEFQTGQALATVSNNAQAIMGTDQFSIAYVSSSSGNLEYRSYAINGSAVDLALNRDVDIAGDITDTFAALMVGSLPVIWSGSGDGNKVLQHAAASQAAQAWSREELAIDQRASMNFSAMHCWGGRMLASGASLLLPFGFELYYNREQTGTGLEQVGSFDNAADSSFSEVFTVRGNPAVIYTSYGDGSTIELRHALYY